MLKIFRKEKPKVLLTACICMPLLSPPAQVTTQVEPLEIVETTEQPAADEGDSIRDLGPYQSVYVEFAEVLSKYHPELECEELIELAEFIVETSHEHALSPYLVLAVIRVESTFDPCALSKKGAKGLMQIIPRHILGREKVSRDYAFSHHKFYDPYENIGMGVGYLASLVERFGSIEDAVTAYNMGPTRLSRRMRQANRSLTTGYTRKVIRHYEKFQGRTASYHSL